MEVTPGTKTTEAAGTGLASLLALFGAYNGQIPPLYAGAFITVLVICYMTSRTIVKVTALKYGKSVPADNRGSV